MIEVVTEENRAFVYGYALKRLRNPALSEDITQQVMIQAWKHPPRHSKNLPGWLGTIARNAIRSEFRRPHYQKEFLPGEDFPEIAAADGDPARYAAQFVDLETGWQQLEPVQQELLANAVLHSSYEELSANLGVPLGTVESRLHRARRDLVELTR